MNLKYFALLLSGGSVLLVSGVVDADHAHRVSHRVTDWIVEGVTPITYAQWRELSRLPKEQRHRAFHTYVPTTM